MPRHSAAVRGALVFPGPSCFSRSLSFHIFDQRNASQGFKHLKLPSPIAESQAVKRHPMNRFPEFVLILFLVISLMTLLWSLNLRYRIRKLQHRERMAALERGVDLPSLKTSDQPWNPGLYLLRGMIWFFAGIGLAIFLLGLSYTTRKRSGPNTSSFRPNATAHLEFQRIRSRTFWHNTRAPRKTGRSPRVGHSWH